MLKVNFTNRYSDKVEPWVRCEFKRIHVNPYFIVIRRQQQGESSNKNEMFINLQNPVATDFVEFHDNFPTFRIVKTFNNRLSTTQCENLHITGNQDSVFFGPSARNLAHYSSLRNCSGCISGLKASFSSFSSFSWCQTGCTSGLIEATSGESSVSCVWDLSHCKAHKMKLSDTRQDILFQKVLIVLHGAKQQQNITEPPQCSLQ